YIEDCMRGFALPGDTRIQHFENRHQFDLVIVYDGSSSSFDTAPALQQFVQSLYTRPKRSEEVPQLKTLRMPPICLAGGFDAWIGFVRTHQLPFLEWVEIGDGVGGQQSLEAIEKEKEKEREELQMMQDKVKREQDEYREKMMKFWGGDMLGMMTAKGDPNTGPDSTASQGATLTQPPAPSAPPLETYNSAPPPQQFQQISAQYGSASQLSSLPPNNAYNPSTSQSPYGANYNSYNSYQQYDPQYQPYQQQPLAHSQTPQMNKHMSYVQFDNPFTNFSPTSFALPSAGNMGSGGMFNNESFIQSNTPAYPSLSTGVSTQASMFVQSNQYTESLMPKSASNPNLPGSYSSSFSGGTAAYPSLPQRTSSSQMLDTTVVTAPSIPAKVPTVPVSVPTPKPAPPLQKPSTSSDNLRPSTPQNE
ncbi:hypothetical protein HDV05_001883, partial [Chytridiales sp. JEL 0842]